MTTTRPQFTEPNILICQVRNSVSDNWEDYASIKTQEDLTAACYRVERGSRMYRIVTMQMGMTVVYP